ncbi:hypothetical protein CEXT_94241 [Caerostris extrusa]|uniref:Uncharacterized protein n=1 Tax=Caerostris extrusa TaxID=172846 RepID=A0AAV4NXL3_CAEEX|nr:hypothetical protein CEXT_94241 [Caerostris extrusa]
MAPSFGEEERFLCEETEKERDRERERGGHTMANGREKTGGFSIYQTILFADIPFSRGPVRPSPKLFKVFISPITTRGDRWKT